MPSTVILIFALDSILDFGKNEGNITLLIGAVHCYLWPQACKMGAIKSHNGSGNSPNYGKYNKEMLPVLNLLFKMQNKMGVDAAKG